VVMVVVVVVSAAAAAAAAVVVVQLTWELIASQLLKKFSAFYETQNFITMFTRPH
jgi:hypothetical protein